MPVGLLRRRRIAALLAGALLPPRLRAADGAPPQATGPAVPNAANAANAPNARNDRDADDRIAPGRVLAFPRDHGAHPSARIEWWYATGWVAGERGALLGWQLTFFRSRTGQGAGVPGRFAPRQLLFAHAAVTDVAAGTHRHVQRIARWSGDESLPDAHAARADTRIALGRWTFARDAASGAYTARLPAPADGIALDLRLAPTQPLLLQGDAGHSRKGPQVQQASHYYSQPQLAATGTLVPGGPVRQGRGWLDHEWSDELLAPGAVGWDWIGINLLDGGALTAFVLRRADGSVVWAGGSHRPAGGGVRAFAPDEVVFTAQRTWTSPATGGRYPVEWTVTTPAGRHGLRALLDAQELDSRASAGTVYWEGLAELLGPGGARIGLGYLEMTGRAQALRLG
jgi:predicted secreted hydrolase